METVFIAFTLKNSSVAQFFVEVAKRLSENHRVVLFTHAVEKHPFQLNPGIKVLEWPSKRPTKLADVLFLVKQIRKENPCVMISNFAAVNIFLLIGFLFRIPQRVAWYHTLTSQLEKRKFLQLRKRMIYKLASRIIANSNASKNDLVENFKVPESKISVIHNALVDQEISVSKVNGKVVYAGRLDAVKGVQTLIRAMPLVVSQFPGIKLHLIGDEETGDAVSELKYMVSKLQLNSNVVFRGNMSRDRVLKEFSSACFSVAPSRSEAFGYVVIESFLSGTPVIGSDTSGIAEILRDKRDGFLFKVGDFEELAQKMIQLLENEPLRNEMSMNCRNRFLEDFEVSVSVDRLEKIMELD